MDNLQEPLLADGEQHEDANISPDPAKGTEPAGPGLVVLLLTFAAGIAGLLFGCKLISTRFCNLYTDYDGN